MSDADAEPGFIHARHQSGFRRKTVCGLWLAGGIVDVWQAGQVTCPACRARLASWNEKEPGVREIDDGLVHLQQPFIRAVLTVCGLTVQGVPPRRIYDVTCQACLKQWELRAGDGPDVAGEAAVYAPGSRADPLLPDSPGDADWSAYRELADAVREAGEPHPGSTYLQVTAGSARVLCRVHGDLTPTEGQDGMRGWTSDWTSLCELARDHVADDVTAGECAVALELRRGAVYAREVPVGDCEREGDQNGEEAEEMTEIEIDLEPDMEERLRALAAKRGVELEELIREAVRAGLEADGVGAVYAPGSPVDSIQTEHGSGASGMENSDADCQQ